MERITRKKGHVTQYHLVDHNKPSKKKWRRRGEASLRLISQLSPIITSLTTIATILRDIAADHRLDSFSTSLNIERVDLIGAGSVAIRHELPSPGSQLDHWLHQAVELEDTSIKATELPYTPTRTVSRRSSVDSFHSALSSGSDSASSIMSITGTVTSRPCEPFWPC